MARAQIVELLLAGFTDNSGNPLNAGKVYTYAAGTTTNKATWTDNLKVTQAANPIVLDSNGRKQIYADGAYKFVIKDSSDNTLYTWDNLWFGISNGATYLGGTSTGAANVYAVTVSPAPTEYEDGMFVVFQAHQTCTAACTLNVNSLGAKSFTAIFGSIIGQIQSGQNYIARYRQSTDDFVILNPSHTRTTWTPAVTNPGAQTYAPTFTLNKYFQRDKLVHAVFACSGTLGGTPNDHFAVSLPVTNNGDAVSGSVTLTDNGAIVTGSISFNSTTKVDIYRYDEAAFTAGTVAATVSLFYESA